jgi:hypothetical protein
MSTGWRCDVREWMVRCARAMTRSGMLPLLEVPRMRAAFVRASGAEVEVHGVFTRALREADRRRMGAFSVREK